MRTHLRDATRCATTTGYGPRFCILLDSYTKAAPTQSIIGVTAPDRTDLPIPNQPYTFSILKQAQALGDFRSAFRRRRAIRVDLGADTTAGLRRLRDLIAG